MTRITEIGKEYKQIGAKLPKLLAEYDELLEEAKDIIRIKGKTLASANRENPAQYAFYAHKTAELKALVDYMEIRLKAIQSRLYRQYREKSDLDLSEREIIRYTENEERYLEFKLLMLEVKEVYDQFKELLNAFTMRSYALNNITKARIAELHEIEI